MKLKSINRHQACTISGLAASLLLAMPAAMAQTDSGTGEGRSVATDADANVFKLGIVSVYGDKQTEAEKTETVVSRDEINLLEKKDIGTALSLVPGVFHNRSLNWRQETGVTVRGYSLREVPIFLDGIPVSIPYDGYSDLSRFTTADVSSIHVAKGYSSVMYGHNTMGGAINIVSLRPRSALDASVIAGTATGNVKELGANVGTLQENWYLQAGVSSYSRDYTRLSENYVGTEAKTRGETGTPRSVNSDGFDYRTRDQRGSVKIGYIPNATDEYVLSYSKQDASKKSGDGSNGFRPYQQEWSYWDRETVSFVSTTRFLNNQFYVKPRIYHDIFKNSLDWFQGRAEGSHYDDKAFGASVEVGTEIIADHLLKAMVSVKDEQHGEFTTDIYTGAQKGSAQKMKQKFVSVALEDTWTINKAWEMQAGAIYTRRTADAGELGPNTIGIINQYPEAASMLSPSIDTVDPQIAFFYKPTNTDTFRASVSRKTRFPSFKQVYSNFGAGSEVSCPAGQSGCTAGDLVPLLSLQNPGLKPEKAMHYEVGYMGSPVHGMSLEGSVYYSRSKDAITRTDRDYTIFPGYAVTQNINMPGITERKGLDIGMRYEVVSQLSLGASYGYLHMKNKDNPDYRFTYMPRHTGVVFAEISPIEWVKVIPSIEFRSNSYYNTTGQNKNPGYSITNLKVALAPLDWKGITVNLGVENMFDKNYAGYNEQYASPGRAFYANLRYDFH